MARVDYYPFRPRLEGLFLRRFSEKAQLLCSAVDLRGTIDEIAQQEYEWATDLSRVNPRQRRIYRAAWLFLRDLVRAGWTCAWSDSTLQMAPPVAIVETKDPQVKAEEKNRTRAAMSEARRQKLAESKDFILRMENPSPKARAQVPVTRLIADGEALAEELRAIALITDVEEQRQALRQAVKPYVQLVEPGAVCSETGHKLSDIWRYFRLTWSNPAENTPGRTMLYLIRDAAREFHPVMGIASLENAPIRIASRDDYLGWSLDAFVRELESGEDAITSVRRLLQYIDVAIGDIDSSDLCSPEELEQPTDSVLERLAAVADHALKEREEVLLAWEEQEDRDSFERSSLGNIPMAAEEALYRRKRADQLHRLLAAKKTLEEVAGRVDLSSRWAEYLGKEQVQTAVRASLQAQKSRHVGTSILELNVCGAIPPYNEILGGKLVALAMLSPQVVEDYRFRYGNRPSDIASRLKGEEVIRPADLVYLGTTSLYRVGSSQYSRLRLPKGLLRPDGPQVKWEPIGETTGYGTLHISRLTLKCLEEVANDGRAAKVNHVFGEGPSPKMRIVRSGLEQLLESTYREDIDVFHKHAMSRLVYGCFLATNGRRYLLGLDDKPNYYFSDDIEPWQATDVIIDYWRCRWLQPRIQYRPALERMRHFDPNTLVVSRDLDVQSEPVFREIEEGAEIVTAPDLGGQTNSLTFVRDLYRGMSAYADHVSLDLLNAIHVETDLDHEIVEAVSNGKSVVLTGNPGDGKSHLLRVLHPRIERYQPLVVMDASSISDEELLSQWQLAVKTSRPFCLAINEAVLLGMAERYSDFEPLRQAGIQARRAVLYDSELDDEFDVCVYDLSRRNVLSNRVVDTVIDKLIDPDFITTCSSCPVEGCDFKLNRRLLRIPMVRERLQVLLDRVSGRGYHATLRELQGLVSYLLFAGRDCVQLMQTSGEQKYAFPQLPFQGKGLLFDKIRETFDPGKVTHPTWDEAMISGNSGSSKWISDWSLEARPINPSDSDAICFRKRAFYFFHENGQVLLDMAGDDETAFFEFLDLDSREAVRRLFRMVNSFFGAEQSGDTLQVWQSHRYNHAPRRMLYSTTSLKRRHFEIVHPRLRSTMSRAFDLAKDHVVFRLREKPTIRLRVDFPLFSLLSQASRGVPVMFLETDETRRLWNFMESLAEAGLHDGEARVELRDLVTGEQIAVSIDTELIRYLQIEVRES